MKIKKLYIKSFRGIPNECVLDFCGKGENAKSVIIYGGNGSGKSSIVDAIEFNLQGRIERNIDIKDPKRPSALNLLPEEYINAYTKIEFDNNTTNERSIFVEKDEVNNRFVITASSEELHESFKEVSLALRRNEIISYNNEQEKLRQFFIASFIYSEHVEEIVNSHKDIEKINNRIKLNNEEIFTKTLSLSELVGYSINEINEHKEGVENFIRRKFSPKGTDFMSLKHSFKKGKGLENKEIVDSKRFDKYIQLAEEIDELNKYNEKIKKERVGLKDIYRRCDLPQYLEQEYYPKAELFLTDAFKRISNVDYINKIRLSRGERSLNSLSIKVLLYNGKEVSPTEIFSEANYDLMVLLLYLSIIRVGVEDKKQAKVLIIDDVLQSVDANIRTRFMSYVFQELKDWQFIITCHDKLWLNQLKHLFKCNGVNGYREFHILNWKFETGPIIREEGINVVDESIKQALATNNMKIISATTGAMLEKICNELTMNCRFSIERAYADKYELQDLWNAVKSKFKKDKDINEICKGIDQVYYLRNTYGAHYNQWAESMNDEEVLRFANLVQELYERTFCPGCYSWIKRLKGSNAVKCSCGMKHIEFK